MDRGLIVLACPGAGGARDRLVANLLVFDLLHAARARAELAPAQRRAFFVFLDEVQTYDGAAAAGATMCVDGGDHSSTPPPKRARIAANPQRSAAIHGISGTSA
jgi:hypothetical protein